MAVLASLGDDRCSVEDCRRMIGGVDADGDGFVCFDEFTRMMTQGL
jgi:calcium-binding protein CML